MSKTRRISGRKRMSRKLRKMRRVRRGGGQMSNLYKREGVSPSASPNGVFSMPNPSLSPPPMSLPPASNSNMMPNRNRSWMNKFTPGRKVQMAQNYARKAGQTLKNMGSRAAFAVTPSNTRKQGWKNTRNKAIFAVTPGPRAAAALNAVTPGAGAKQAVGVVGDGLAYGMKSAAEGAAAGLGGLASGLVSAGRAIF